jgi:hypothetical protein
MKTIHLAPGVDTGLATLIDTRCLVQANSGGGKSWCLRRLLEQSHGSVQHLVLDPEGEFASLRERFDYVLAAKHGGDTAAEPRAAGLLAQRLLELGVSAIVDLYELKAHERVRFVRGFLEALVDAPKKLWHPALVVLDEAHVFCPQQGEAESASAVIDLCTRGRKRGFGSVLATQRLSKLHKDAAAELNNKLIGRTGLDVDVKRAADELGFTKERWRELRELEAGEFFVFGPAMSREVRKVRIGSVQTTHPKAGARLAFVAPPPTDRIRALLPKLSDLPAEQERKAKTEADLRAELQSLRGQLAAAERRVPAAPAPKVREVPVLKDAQVKRLEAAIARFGTASDRVVEQMHESLDALHRREKEAAVEARGIRQAIERFSGAQAVAATRRELGVGPIPSKTVFASRPQPPVTRPAPTPSAGDVRLGRGETAILTAIAQHENAGVTREQLTVLTGYKRSSRDTYLQHLLAAGMAEQSRHDASAIVATSQGLHALGPDFEPLPTGDELRAHWMDRLGGGEKVLFELVIGAYPDAVERDVLSEASGYQRSSRDTFLQRLAARRLIVTERGAVRASEILFS